MTTYLDTSVILRVVLGEPKPLAMWSRLKDPVTSAITEIECLRTLDRGRLRGQLEANVVAERMAAVYDVLRRLTVVDLTRPVLARAGAPFPAPVGTLDALHLATALMWREALGAPAEFQLATHDAGLALAARACGLLVIGDV